jgi:uncharacterized protein (DUF58 family)
MRFVPSRLTIGLIATAMVVATVVSFAGVSLDLVGWATTVFLSVVLALGVIDVFWTRVQWRAAQVRFVRRLPSAFAIGVRKPVHVQLATQGSLQWRCEIFDHCDSSLRVEGMPASCDLFPGKSTDLAYEVTPTRRGEIDFAAADLRVRSRLRLVDLIERAGPNENRRAYPDFAQVSRYAWLAGDRRLQEIGIKTFQRRGEGTDFKQLSEYRYGDPVRHIDWKATLRQNKPILREFQDERDQCVMLLIDCGRRMRAHDVETGIGSGHFDQVLNAVMLLSYVALRQGDAVGALTFGTPEDDARVFAPRKGAHALNALMGELYSVQPTPTHSDYLSVAVDRERRHHNPCEV